MPLILFFAEVFHLAGNYYSTVYDWKLLMALPSLGFFPERAFAFHTALNLFITDNLSKYGHIPEHKPQPPHMQEKQNSAITLLQILGEPSKESKRNTTLLYDMHWLTIKEKIGSDS